MAHSAGCGIISRPPDRPGRTGSCQFRKGFSHPDVNIDITTLCSVDTQSSRSECPTRFPRFLLSTLVNKKKMKGLRNFSAEFRVVKLVFGIDPVIECSLPRRTTPCLYLEFRPCLFPGRDLQNGRERSRRTPDAGPGVELLSDTLKWAKFRIRHRGRSFSGRCPATICRPRYSRPARHGDC